MRASVEIHHLTLRFSETDPPQLKKTYFWCGRNSSPIEQPFDGTVKGLVWDKNAMSLCYWLIQYRLSKHRPDDGLYEVPPVDKRDLFDTLLNLLDTPRKFDEVFGKEQGTTANARVIIKLIFPQSNPRKHRMATIDSTLLPPDSIKISRGSKELNSESALRQLAEQIEREYREQPSRKKLGENRGAKEVPDAPLALTGTGPNETLIETLFDFVPEDILRGHGNFVWDVAVTPEGRVVSASNDKTAIIWDAKTRSHLHTFRGHTAEVCSLAVSLDGHYLATGAKDGNIIVFSLRSDDFPEKARLRHKARDAKVCWGPAPSQLACGGGDGTIRIWDFPSAKLRRVFRIHEDPILKVISLDDGDRLISVSADKTIRICSVSSAKCLRILDGHTGEVNSAAVAPDKSWLVSASEDRSLRLWDIS